ncbi:MULTISPECIES: response regulator transcription factor [unclassified Synechocystis]|uniref:response regulator transcription factor n=1 Tax=unclassified Synechocystis TaxID=2640012 RepID=UPI000421DE50|nr:MULTISPECIES: response regulator transcription factor [unclassified Synechocystis]AIE75634.1 OmpR subfamily [Synechocystis sp. PCC 6714]MCT0253825.1 response regulator transcription factor [Synechocystis sp. CS-94]
MANILLVDDENALTEPLSKALGHQGHSIDIADQGKTGLAMAIAGQYDLLILDWMLPQVSGLEICRQIRTLGHSTPVLFLTAKDTLDDRVAGLDAGGDDYLVKPFQLRELLARVRALLRRQGQGETGLDNGSGGRGSLLSVNNISLDIANQVAYCQGQRIALSEKEVALLTLFLQAPGQILSHEEIYSHLWPGESPPSSNVLAALVRLLRRKIEQPNTPRLINSVYGKGYCFEVN